MREGKGESKVKAKFPVGGRKSSRISFKFPF